MKAQQFHKRMNQTLIRPIMHLSNGIILVLSPILTVTQQSSFAQEIKVPETKTLKVEASKTDLTKTDPAKLSQDKSSILSDSTNRAKKELVTKKGNLINDDVQSLVDMRPSDTVKIDRVLLKRISNVKIIPVDEAETNFQNASKKLEELHNRSKSKDVLTLEQQDALKAEVNIARSDYAKAATEKELAENKDQIKFGSNVRLIASVGPTLSLTTLYDPTISPVDSTLRLQKIYPVSFLLSTGVLVSAKSKKKPTLTKTADLKTTDDIHAENYSLEPSQFALLANVNLATFSSSTSAFNQKITGGIGIAYFINVDFYLAVTYEINMARQLRDYYVTTFENKPIILGTTPKSPKVTSLDQSNNAYFYDKYYSGLSVKFVYVITGKTPK